jgi:hypothetical protein
MKHQSIVCFTKALLVLAGISVGSAALAQEIAHEAIRPNKTVTYTITGEGDVNKVTGIEIQFNSKRDSPPSDQQGYQTSFGSGRLAPKPGASRESIEVTVTIPASVASGEYWITQINASTASGASARYVAPQDFMAPPALRIDNPERFKMRLKTVTEEH